MSRHSWSEKVKYANHSDATCWNCSLIKRTRHESRSHWTEYVRAGVVVSRDLVPACVGVAPYPAEYLEEAA